MPPWQRYFIIFDAGTGRSKPPAIYSHCWALAQKAQRSLTLSDNEDSPSTDALFPSRHGRVGRLYAMFLINGYVTMSDAYSYSF